MENTKTINKNQLQYLQGVGPKRAEAFANEGIYSKKDLINYFPRSYIDRNSVSSIKQLKEEILNGEIKLFEQENIEKIISSESMIFVRIVSKRLNMFGRGKTLFSLRVKDEQGDFANINFWQRVKYFEKLFQEGMFIIISGKPNVDKYGVSFTHPEFEIINEEDKKLYSEGIILPKYKISDIFQRVGISVVTIRSIIFSIIDEEIKNFNENLPEWIIQEYNILDIHSTIKNLHFPETKEKLNRALYRMKFEELFFYQLKLGFVKKYNRTNNVAPKIIEKSISARSLYDNLPFKLTKDQKRVINEINNDLISGISMNRLLQGDVGSGKTIVSVFVMLMSVDNGFQTAIMAPTEILAEQHYFTINTYLANQNIEISLLTGSLSLKQKKIENERIKSGEVDIVIGTHAIFQKKIEFNKLALIVIDEQHRFGVEQRKDLINKAVLSFPERNITPHVLYMSATPIPRTLTMTAYGDLDVSIIKSKPSNRQEVQTIISYEKNKPKLYNFIYREIEKGRQVFFVYPLVGKSEKLDLKSAIEQYDIINDEVFPDLSVGLLHGQMNWKEKEEIMKNFSQKAYDILVTTTVIEVGIDIPNASVMVIEHAERFGLSQLHQLRGRVGRSEFKSFCILVTKDSYEYLVKSHKEIDKEKITSIIRLKTMEKHIDGFEIAEVDLKLRGPGDVLGTKQSGIPDFQFADIIKDFNILRETKELTNRIINEDPKLENKKNIRIREYLKNEKIFEDNYFGIA